MVFGSPCLSTGNLPQRSSLWALSLSLSAVNLSESAQAKMAPAQLTQIYVTAATALRTVLGHHLSFLPVGSRTQNKLRRWCTSVVSNLLHNTILFISLQSYLLSCAENVATKPVPDCLHWLFTPLGRQFFLSCDWSVKSESTCEIYTSQRDPGMLQEKQLTWWKSLSHAILGESQILKHLYPGRGGLTKTNM